MKKSIQSSSEKDTKKIARELAFAIKQTPKRKGAFVIALQGELGAGKTTFVQGLARGLGAKGNILSPTFLIAKSYKLPAKRTFWHIDCYRLKNKKELLDLGWKDIAADPGTIAAVEWADRVKEIIPKDALWISLADKERDLTNRIIVIG